MSWKKFWRIVARSWMGLTLMTDLVLFMILLADPNHRLYELAATYNWNIDPSWVGVAFPIITMMLWYAHDVIFLNRPMSIYLFGCLTIISSLWAVDLLFYETLILDEYHWTKIADGIRWATFGFAAWYYKFRSSPWSS